jgi:hypothetical protein
MDKNETEIASDWCTAYEAKCTSFSRDTSDPDCLKIKEIRSTVASAVEEALGGRATQKQRVDLLNGLKAALREAVETRSR